MASYKLTKLLKSPIPLAYLPYALLFFGLIGFVDATYLTIIHYKNVIPPCTLSGCETVLSSAYAELIPGIPTSLIGVGFYGVVMVLAGVYIQYSSSERSESRSKILRPASQRGEQAQDDKKNSSRQARTISTLLFALCSAGLLVGILLVGIQAFVLHAYCQYCLLSELVDFLLFDTAWWLYNSFRSEN